MNHNMQVVLVSGPEVLPGKLARMMGCVPLVGRACLFLGDPIRIGVGLLCTLQKRLAVWILTSCHWKGSPNMRPELYPVSSLLFVKRGHEGSISIPQSRVDELPVQSGNSHPILPSLKLEA